MRKIRPRRFVKRRKDEKTRFFSGKENLIANSDSPGSFFQPKLEIGDPSDVSEKEADKMADQVVRHPRKNSQKTAFNNDSVQGQEKSTISKASAEKEEEPAAKRIRRQAEKEELETKRIQKQEEEEEPAAKLIQRQNEESAYVQTSADKEEEVATKKIQPQMEEEEEPATKRIQKQAEEEEEPVQAKLNQGHSEINLANQSVKNKSKQKGSEDSLQLEDMIRETKGMGMALPDDIRTEMEGKFNADFSKVRVHTGDKAVVMTNMLKAQAFTHGFDIYFNAGKYQPNTSLGKHLLAHELTHVVQQKG